MKIIERITLTIFSTIMLIISLVFCLLIFGWLDFFAIDTFITKVLTNQTYSNIALGVSVVFILLSIRCIFFISNDNQKDELKNGILLENSDGKLLITAETIENLVNGVVKGFDSAEDANTKIELDPENNVIVLVNLKVKENAIIKELSTNLQTKIKETVKRSTDLDVKEVNIQVKNIEPIVENVQE